MDRPLLAVILGTFTLRFSTGLTGGLLVYYLAKLPHHGGPQVSATELGILTAAFYLAELTLAPLLGMLSDRVGHRRLMQVGPAFGAVAVIVTGLTTNLVLLGGTRLLEGASTAASVPSILGFIAAISAGNELRRGRAAARFEGATLAGLGVGLVASGPLFEVLGRSGFFLNAGIYVVSFLIYRYGVPDIEGRNAPRAAHPGLRRYGRILRASHVWLLAPTWIAINAVLGLWTSQTLFQLVKEPLPRFAEQRLMGGFAPVHVSLGLGVGLLVFFAGLGFWGERFKRYRRTSIISVGILGGAIVAAAGFLVNHSAGWPWPVVGASGLAVAAGLFILAGATPAALGLLADVTESFPADRGAIMGLYSVFLAVGQIGGSLIGGVAADRQGIDGLLVATVVLLAIALLPLHRLRHDEDHIGVLVDDGSEDDGHAASGQPTAPATERGPAG
jgi:MFS family permease